MGTKHPGNWSILTLEVRRERADEIAEWIREGLGTEPVELQRAGMPASWLELYFDSEIEAEIAVRALAGRFPVAAWNIRSMEDRDWQSFWRAHFRSQNIGKRLLIAPVWEEPANEDGRVLVTIDPGMSFGTGDHFTTRFCIEMIDRLFEAAVPSSFLDVGTGSGILAVAAAKLGCPCVTALECDPVSLQSARENVEANQVSDRVKLVEHDIRNGWPGEASEVVCANLFGALLVEVAPTLLAASARYLVLTGIMEREADYVADCYVDLGAEEYVRDSEGEWTGLLLETAQR